MSRNTRPVPYQTIRGTATLDMHGNTDVLANGIRRTDHSAAANSAGPHPFLTSRRTQLQSHQGVEDATHQEEHADCDSDRCNDHSDSEGSSSDDLDSDEELYQNFRRAKSDTRGRAHSGLAISNPRTPTAHTTMRSASSATNGRGANNYMGTNAGTCFPFFNGAANVSIMGGTFTSTHNAPVGQTPAFFDGVTNVSISGGTFGNVNNTHTGQAPFSSFFNGATNISIGGNATFISGNTTYSMSSQPSASNSRDDERAMRRELIPNAQNVRINGYVRRTYHSNGEHHRMNGAVWEEAYHSKYGCY